MKVYRDKFGNPLKVGDYVVMPEYVFGMHLYYISDAVKIVGFHEEVYGDTTRTKVITEKRYPIWERGKPDEGESTDRVVKTTLRNYLFCQKRMLKSDKENRADSFKINTPLYFTTYQFSNRPQGVPDWIRPHIDYEYHRKDGKLVHNHPQTRKRKARKMRRQVTDVSKYITKTEVADNECHSFSTYAGA